MRFGGGKRGCPSNLGVWPNETLVSAAKLIQRYHDATSGSKLAGLAEVVCHNDLSPCNTVFQAGNPVALIDFDAAAPGRRIDDLAYAIWLWCDIGNEDISVVEQSQRIRIFKDAAGIQDRKNIIASIIDIQRKQIEQYQNKVILGLSNWENAVSWANNSLDWIIKHQEELENSL